MLTITSINLNIKKVSFGMDFPMPPPLPPSARKDCSELPKKRFVPSPEARAFMNIGFSYGDAADVIDHADDIFGYRAKEVLLEIAKELSEAMNGNAVARKIVDLSQSIKK